MKRRIKMKKKISIIIIYGLSLAVLLLLVFMLSGCDKEVTQDEIDYLYDFYIQENEQDIDELESKVRIINEYIYELESELRDFERFEYEDLLEFEASFDDWEDYLGEYILALEQRIEELEKLPNPNLCDYEDVFRVRYMERVSETVYIIEKYGYTTQAYYQIYTEQSVILGSITYAAIYEDGSAVLFSEIICAEKGE
jgi:hypothetical protein